MCSDWLCILLLVSVVYIHVIERVGVWWWPEIFGFVVGDAQWAIISTFAVIVSVVRISRGICSVSILLVTIVLVSSLRSISEFGLCA